MTDEEEKFTQYGQGLYDAISKAIRPWLNHQVLNRVKVLDDEMARAIEICAAQVEESIADLAAADVDAPLSGPLERIRQGVEPLNAMLDQRGVDPPLRNAMDQQMRPGDRHELGPMTFRDLGDAVHDAGISWGAAKAHLHLQRRRSS